MCCLRLHQIGLLTGMMADTDISERDRSAITALIAEISTKPCDEILKIKSTIPRAAHQMNSIAE